MASGLARDWAVVQNRTGAAREDRPCDQRQLLSLHGFCWRVDRDMGGCTGKY
jgi:hypothetical protein